MHALLCTHMQVSFPLTHTSFLSHLHTHTSKILSPLLDSYTAAPSFINSTGTTGPGVSRSWSRQAGGRGREGFNSRHRALKKHLLPSRWISTPFHHLPQIAAPVCVGLWYACQVTPNHMASHPTRQTRLSDVCLCWLNYRVTASFTPDSICPCALCVCRSLRVFVCFGGGGCLSGIALMPIQACCRMGLVCVVCACVNPSGNDSEASGPVGIVQQCHFQVPVSTLLLQHFFLSRRRTQTN